MQNPRRIAILALAFGLVMLAPVGRRLAADDQLLVDARVAGSLQRHLPAALDVVARWTAAPASGEVVPRGPTRNTIDALILGRQLGHPRELGRPVEVQIQLRDVDDSWLKTASDAGSGSRCRPAASAAAPAGRDTDLAQHRVERRLVLAVAEPPRETWAPGTA